MCGERIVHKLTLAWAVHCLSEGRKKKGSGFPDPCSSSSSEVGAAEDPYRVAARDLVMRHSPICALADLRLFRQLRKTPRDEQHGQSLVGMLATLGLHLDADAGADVGGCRVRLCDGYS
jgi:hypothetical protein